MSQQKSYVASYDSPIGRLYLAFSEMGLTQLSFTPIADNSASKSPYLEKLAAWLDAYFAAKNPPINFPLDLHGSNFQKAAWQVLAGIAYGKTISYAEEASRLGNAKASRAVGNANGKNPIAIIIPCHRVIAKNGEIGGYAGGLDKKRFLLDLESAGV